MQRNFASLPRPARERPGQTGLGCEQAPVTWQSCIFFLAFLEIRPVRLAAWPALRFSQHADSCSLTGTGALSSLPAFQSMIQFDPEHSASPSYFALPVVGTGWEMWRQRNDDRPIRRGLHVGREVLPVKLHSRILAVVGWAVSRCKPRRCPFKLR